MQVLKKKTAAEKYMLKISSEKSSTDEHNK